MQKTSITSISADSNLESIIKIILESCYLMSLATIDDSGPWVSDVVYVNDNDFNIYWLSKPDTRHSKAIREFNNVAASVTYSNMQGEDNIGLQISGRAKELNENNVELAKLHLKKRKKTEDPNKILDLGQKWYKLEPGFIDIIYEPLWGFKKMKFKI